MQDKKLLREEMLSKRKSISLSGAQENSNKIAESLSNFRLFKEAKSVLFYSPIDNEVDVTNLAKEALNMEIKVIFPRVTANGLQLHEINSFEDLTLGKYGIMGPHENLPQWNINNIDLILVPGIAFNKHGFRLGYGYGYYDKLLQNLDIPCIGLAFDWQIIDVSQEKHDIPVQHIITNKEIINCNNILDGKKVAKSVLQKLAQIIRDNNLIPKLSIILVGNNPESQVYTRIKRKRSREIGIDAEIFKFDSNISEQELVDNVKKLSKSSNGVIVQLPLPNHINTQKILDCVDPSKDVDGLTVTNQGLNSRGEETLSPATPKGVIRLLDEYNIQLKGKKITIINRSNLVGKPLASMLINRRATVTVCHSATVNLQEHTSHADIVISAVGIPNFIKEDMVKEGSVIIDVGTSKQNDSITGDVDFRSVSQKASYITPVPGGVGPMTVAMLLENVVEATLQARLNK